VVAANAPELAVETSTYAAALFLAIDDRGVQAVRGVSVIPTSK